MNCQSCQKFGATVKVVEPIYHEDGTTEIRKLQLCAGCAKSAGVPIAGLPSSAQVVSMLGKILLKPPMEIVPAGQDATCPECGWTLKDFRQTSRFGCPQDYEVFGDFVVELLERIHGTAEHQPPEGEAAKGRLRKRLAEAVEKEDYEAAARIRDEIQELEVAAGHLEETDEKSA